ncbi:MAG: hydrogenase iron-sulfur subunit, partial [Candidatus Bathyarchaeia archaeon]
IDVTEFGFFKSMGSPAPVDTSVPGIYLCGACEGAKDISHSVAQASASAARATSCAGPVKAGVERIEAKERPLGREPRVGAFVCDCGVNIRAVVDVPRVVEFAKSLDGVVHAEEFMFACSKDSIDKIKEAIGRCNLNRVVVASCTPRTHEPLFRATCEEVGLNPYLFEMVNIREHDSWVHTGQPEEATRKAMDLVRMAVAKARRLHPLKRLETDVERSALVVGGSIAGMVAAKAIADNGFKVYLVEGGEGLGRPYSDEFVLPFENIDINSLLSPLIRQVENHENIQVFLSTRVKEVKGALGSLDVTLLQESHTNTLKTGVIIVATEGEKLKPHGLYGYGEYEDVVTTPEFRQMVGQGKIADGETIALILCVGAREREGRTYCSAVCCSEAVDLVHWVKKRWPKSQIYVLYRDMVLPLEGEAWYSEARERGIVFIRYAEELPPKVSLVEKQLTISVRDVTLGSRLNITADKIVLVTPMIPGKTNPNLASTLKVPLTTQGFFLEAHPKLRPLDFATDGIYLCGTCHSPQGIAEAVFQGLGAASRALVPLMKARVSSEAITAEVDPNRCIACGNCEAVCEYGSIRVDGSFAEVNPFLCKGCGLCSVECPAMAITMHHYTDDQTSSMIREATEAWRHEDKLRALAFFCNWCAYAAADMAGVSRFQYPPTVRIIRVMCTGRVDQTHVLQAFLDGADGVLIGGCHPGDCHYVAGNIKAEGRVRKMKRWLKEAGLEPERLSLVWVSAGEGKILAEAIEDFTNQLEGLGPSPLREVRGG